jgi:hypothetical protein
MPHVEGRYYELRPQLVLSNCFCLEKKNPGQKPGDEIMGECLFEAS